MGKSFRRASVAGIAFASSALMVGSAFAAPSDSYKDNEDEIRSVHSIDNNIDDLFRVAGPNRVHTSIQLMNASAKWSGNENDTVIVARADVYADALASGPLADVYDAPVLLTGPGGIDPAVLNAIAEKGFSNAILVGGTGVFPSSAMQQLEAVVGTGDVQQVGGLDRYETAVDIARHVGWRVAGGAFGGEEDGGVTPWHVNVYLSTGEDFADALASGAAAADNDGVVLLSKDGEIPNVTMEFLQEQSGWNSIFSEAVFNSKELYTVGGQAERAVDAEGIENVVKHYTGKNRYETAVMLAGDYKHPIETIAISSGEGFADGVAGAAWVANRDGALLLTKNSGLTNVTADFLTTNNIHSPLSDVETVVIGGTGSVSKTVSDELVELFSF